MESLVRRLKYYGIGFGIGLIFIFFFFNNRGCAWMPSNRVKNTVMDRLLVVSDDTAKELKEKGITSDDIVQVLNDGEVDFSASNKDKQNKAYLISKEGESFVFTLPYESFISEVFLAKNVSGIKTSTVGEGDIIHFPKDDNMVFSDTTKLMTCQQEMLKLIGDKQIFDKIKKTARINFEMTDLTIRPKPEHYLYFEHDGEIVGAEMIWYKTKLNIASFVHPSLKDCQ